MFHPHPACFLGGSMVARLHLVFHVGQPLLHLRRVEAVPNGCNSIYLWLKPIKSPLKWRLDIWYMHNYMYIYIYVISIYHIWVICNDSLTWKSFGDLGMISLTVIPVGPQWDRYNLPRCMENQGIIREANK